MTTLTLHITNQDILPSLIDTLKHFNGVSIVTPNDCTSNNPTLLDKKISKGISEYKEGKGYKMLDDEAMDEKVIAAAQKLQNGEVSDVIEVKDRGYYVIRMDKTHDESATKDKKKSLASQKREAAFNKKMNTWKKKIRFTLDKKLWKQIKFTDLFTTASGNATR